MYNGNDCLHNHFIAKIYLVSEKSKQLQIFIFHILFSWKNCFGSLGKGSKTWPCFTWILPHFSCIISQTQYCWWQTRDLCVSVTLSLLNSQQWGLWGENTNTRRVSSHCYRNCEVWKMVKMSYFCSCKCLRENAG